MKILWLLHTYWHTSVPLGKVSHLPPLRQDSASCEHRKPVKRGTALATAQGPGGSRGDASPGVTRAGDRLAESPRPPVSAQPGEVGSTLQRDGWSRDCVAPALRGSPKNKPRVGLRVGCARSSSWRTDTEKAQIRPLIDKCHLGKNIQPGAH